MSHLPRTWKERLLHLLIAPEKLETFRFLEAWARAEGGTAENNPLNTTYPMPWSSTYNSIGVRNYDSPIEGISATASTVARDPLYRPLWIDLQNGGYTAEQLVDRNHAAISHWGTDIGLLRRVLKDL